MSNPSPTYPILHTDATSLDTAKIAQDYPYGRLRCKMHFYVEHRPKMGYRAVTQSINPKNGRLNKPHAGTYSPVPIYVSETAEGFFEFVYVPRYPEKANEFIQKYWKQIPEQDQKYLVAWWGMQIKLSPNSYKELILLYPTE